MKSIWLNTLAWGLAVTLALALAFAAPSESTVMGKLPSLMAKRLDQQPVPLPQGLPSDRTLALIAFSKHQQPEVESWINGLQLRRNTDINWLRMPVLQDPGHAQGRSAIENRLLARYASPGERERMLPVFHRPRGLHPRRRAERAGLRLCRGPQPQWRRAGAGRGPVQRRQGVGAA